MLGILAALGDRSELSLNFILLLDSGILSPKTSTWSPRLDNPAVGLIKVPIEVSNPFFIILRFVQ